MPLYKITSEALHDLPAVSFAAVQLREREDLQRLLRDRIDTIAPGALVISEEFGDWEDASRRIDLLAVDPDGTLVVIELKITPDGGHMELQALRYAAMVAPMTFDQAVTAFGRYLRSRGSTEDARERLLRHLGAQDDQDPVFAPDVRIVLVSADFSREITTTVLWLRDRDVDVRCVRIRLHQLDGTVVADMQQVIPLPEAEQYQVRLREKAQEDRAARRLALTPDPTLDEMWERLRSALTAAEFDAARDVAHRVGAMGAVWFANRASLAQAFSAAGQKYYFFGLRPENAGRLEIWYRHFLDRPPFDQPEVRADLLARMAAIPGLEPPLDPERKMPKYPMSILVDENVRDRFCDLWRWVTEIAGSRAAAGGS